MFPTVGDLSLKLKVNDQIVKLAYQELEEGKLGIIQTNGTFIITHE